MHTRTRTSAFCERRFSLPLTRSSFSILSLSLSLYPSINPSHPLSVSFTHTHFLSLSPSPTRTFSLCLTLFLSFLLIPTHCCFWAKQDWSSFIFCKRLCWLCQDLSRWVMIRTILARTWKKLKKKSQNVLFQNRIIAPREKNPKEREREGRHMFPCWNLCGDNNWWMRYISRNYSCCLNATCYFANHDRMRTST